MNTSLKTEQRRFRPRIEDADPFPDSQRVVYARNPLELVICQFRFPPILKISSEPPAIFQDQLRREYPLYRAIPAITLPGGLPAEVSNLVEGMISFPGAKAHEFSSADGAWAVTVIQESLALTCKNYTRWEHFKEHLRLPLELLIRLYEPSFLTRIGLRYRDVIDRSVLGLTDVPWGNLLSKDLAGAFHSAIAPFIEGLTHQVVVKLQNGLARVTIQHGLAQKGEQVCYIIDSDFSVTERTEHQDAMGILDYFNRQSGRLFRWLIADRLHNAMDPRPV
ncbi:MAG: TIGR04255 family protein [Candidatus Acidiferrales bacterium]